MVQQILTSSAQKVLRGSFPDQCVLSSLQYTVTIASNDHAPFDIWTQYGIDLSNVEAS